jgi:hypothetical protein
MRSLIGSNRQQETLKPYDGQSSVHSSLIHVFFMRRGDEPLVDDIMREIAFACNSIRVSRHGFREKIRGFGRDSPNLFMLRRIL